MLRAAPLEGNPDSNSQRKAFLSEIEFRGSASGASRCLLSREQEFRVLLRYSLQPQCADRPLRPWGLELLESQCRACRIMWSSFCRSHRRNPLDEREVARRQTLPRRQHRRRAQHRHPPRLDDAFPTLGRRARTDLRSAGLRAALDRHRAVTCGCRSASSTSTTSWPISTRRLPRCEAPQITLRRTCRRFDVKGRTSLAQRPFSAASFHSRLSRISGLSIS